MINWTDEKVKIDINEFTKRYIEHSEEIIQECNWFCNKTWGNTATKWTWHGQEVQGAFLYYITWDMGPIEAPYLFAGLGVNTSGPSRRMWTRDKSKVAIFSSDKEAQRFINTYFTKKEHNKLLIVREG